MSKPEAPTAASPVLDYIGRPITASATVVYPVRRGSSMWMQKINVTQVIGGKTPTVIGFNSQGRKITLHNVANVVVVEPLPTPTV
jgi:hypothetical protein